MQNERYTEIYSEELIAKKVVKKITVNELNFLIVNSK